MNGSEMKTALADIALTKAKEFEGKFHELDERAVNERRALLIAKTIAENCAGIVNIEFMGQYYEVRERRVFGQEFHDFDEYKPVYETLSKDDKESFLVFSFCMGMVKRDLVNIGAEEPAGSSSNREVQRAFAEKIKRGVKREILLLWQKFWNENGCVKCEVFQ